MAMTKVTPATVIAGYLSSGVTLRTTAGRLGHSDGGATTLKIDADWMTETSR